MINPAANASCIDVRENFWTDEFSTSAQMSLPISFELILTEDLPNGPYGEVAGSGGKLYVAPGSMYNDVAGAACKAWIKSRGSMIFMNTSVEGQFGVPDTKSSYSEDWRVKGIEFKGGPVDKDGKAVAGVHTVHMACIQTVAAGRSDSDRLWNCLCM